jgi:hypothetical protein
LAFEAVPRHLLIYFGGFSEAAIVQDPEVIKRKVPKGHVAVRPYLRITPRLAGKTLEPRQIIESHRG